MCQSHVSASITPSWTRLVNTEGFPLFLKCVGRLFVHVKAFFNVYKKAFPNICQEALPVYIRSRSLMDYYV